MNKAVIYFGATGNEAADQMVMQVLEEYCAVNGYEVVAVISENARPEGMTFPMKFAFVGMAEVEDVDVVVTLMSDMVGDCEETIMDNIIMLGEHGITVETQILKNEVYIGRYVTGKDRVCLYRHEKRHTTNKDEWYVFENHHIALIAKEQFYAVQKNKRKVIKPTKKQTVNMLKGKIICGCCGSSIHIHPEKHAKVYLCTHRKRYGKDSCNCLPVKVDDVYAAVLAVIKEQIQVFVDREMILKEHHNDSRVIRQEQVYTEAVNKCVKEMDRLMELKSGLYADYTEELLDEKEYLQLNREYSQRIEKLKIQADEYRQAASQYESAEKTVAQLKAEMLRFKGKRKLTQEMVDLFVAQVRIYENKNLEIVLNYEDELKKFAELNMEREAG